LAEKTDSVILSVTPYRETSCILRLFTHTLGLVHGIAKGARGGGKSSTPLDRGFLLESLVYYKPNRELHTLGSPHVTNFFPQIRSDIMKSAIRDVALELYLKSITQSEPHPELFELLVSFLTGMEESSEREALFPLLWQFIHHYCMMTGFGIDIDGWNKGGGGGIDEIVVKAIKDIDNGHNRRYYHGEALRITELLLSYCREHLDIRSSFNSLEFLRTI
jgi:recombinational DNA repair protein (RecF pathway)